MTRCGSSIEYKPTLPTQYLSVFPSYFRIGSQLEITLTFLHTSPCSNAGMVKVLKLRALRNLFDQL